MNHKNELSRIRHFLLHHPKGDPVMWQRFISYSIACEQDEEKRAGVA